MAKRKLIIEIDINDDRINSIEDLEQEILAQDIYGQVARKYLGLTDRYPVVFHCRFCTFVGLYPILE